MIVWSQREGIQDRAPREVMRVLGAVDFSRTRAARTTRDPIGYPIVKPLLRESALAPRRKILIPQPKRPQRVGATGPVVTSHSGGSYAPRDLVPALPAPRTPLMF